MDNALQNVMGQMGGGGISQGTSMDPNAQPPQPGDKTDPLLTAMKALQQYNKTTMTRDPKSPELKLVRQIMQELARLTHLDQTLQAQPSNPMQAPMGSDIGVQPDMGGMGGTPQMPDISHLTKLG